MVLKNIFQFVDIIIIKLKYQIIKKFHICSCGETNESNFSKGRFTECKRCRSKRQLDLYFRYKQRSVEYKGGKCSECGYSKCLAALDFHHIDPNEKDPDWHKMRHRNAESIRSELDKCILLCSNCHKELHYQIDIRV